jgi:hypothetical protein
MAIVRYVFAALKPGVDREEYERYEREVDYVIAAKLKSIISYRTHRLMSARRSAAAHGTISSASRSPIARRTMPKSPRSART